MGRVPYRSQPHISASDALSFFDRVPREGLQPIQIDVFAVVPSRHLIPQQIAPFRDVPSWQLSLHIPQQTTNEVSRNALVCSVQPVQAQDVHVDERGHKQRAHFLTIRKDRLQQV